MTDLRLPWRLDARGVIVDRNGIAVPPTAASKVVAAMNATQPTQHAAAGCLGCFHLHAECVCDGRFGVTDGVTTTWHRTNEAAWEAMRPGSRKVMR